MVLCNISIEAIMSVQFNVNNCTGVLVIVTLTSDLCVRRVCHGHTEEQGGAASICETQESLLRFAPPCIQDYCDSALPVITWSRYYGVAKLLTCGAQQRKLSVKTIKMI